MKDADFYVGHFPRPSRALANFVRGVSFSLCVLSLFLAAVLIFAQQPFASAVFEYQQYRPYEGELIEWPYPMLLTRNGRFLLVCEGKHGAAGAVRGLEGKRVAVQGALIRRGRDQMLELRTGSLRLLPGMAPDAKQAQVDLGPIRLSGEIVDSKCYLGVMNPGSGKVHRECAVRCISGGIPPAFRAMDAAGQWRVLLLTGSDSRPLGAEVLNYVAEPIVITGRLARIASQLVLKAEPRDFQRE